MSPIRNLVQVLGCVLFLQCMSHFSFAQATTGSLNGLVVTNDDGSALPGSAAPFNFLQLSAGLRDTSAPHLFFDAENNAMSLGSGSGSVIRLEDNLVGIELDTAGASVSVSRIPGTSTSPTRHFLNIGDQGQLEGPGPQDSCIGLNPPCYDGPFLTMRPDASEQTGGLSLVDIDPGSSGGSEGLMLDLAGIAGLESRSTWNIGGFCMIIRPDIQQPPENGLILSNLTTAGDTGMHLALADAMIMEATQTTAASGDVEGRLAVFGSFAKDDTSDTKPELIFFVKQDTMNRVLAEGITANEIATLKFSKSLPDPGSTSDPEMDLIDILFENHAGSGLQLEPVPADSNNASSGLTMNLATKSKIEVRDEQAQGYSFARVRIVPDKELDNAGLSLIEMEDSTKRKFDIAISDIARIEAKRMFASGTGSTATPEMDLIDILFENHPESGLHLWPIVDDNAVARGLSLDLGSISNISARQDSSGAPQKLVFYPGGTGGCMEITIDDFGTGVVKQQFSDDSSSNAISYEYDLIGNRVTASSGTNHTFNGDVHVDGMLTKSAGTFRIDHPLDPENKYLYHSFVESPDMMNIYNGNVITDDDGLATVRMPDYFTALNIDFRYQLTVVGQFAQAIIAEKINNNQFKIRTDKPNVEVSWMVTGIRNDKWARENRIQVEVNKGQTVRAEKRD